MAELAAQPRAIRIVVRRIAGLPATRTSPPLAAIRPVTNFMMVDLPQPEGPTTATNSPLSMPSVASASAGMLSLPSW